jgi:hypothetical protein
MLDCFKTDAGAVSSFVSNAQAAFKSDHLGVIAPQDRQKLEQEFGQMGPATQETALEQLDGMKKTETGTFASQTIDELRSQLTTLQQSKLSCVKDGLSLRPVSDKGAAVVAKEINTFREEAADLKNKVMDARIDGRRSSE